MFYELFNNEQQAVIFEAAAIIESKAKTTAALTDPFTAAKLCETKLVTYAHEVFAVALLGPKLFFSHQKYVQVACVCVCVWGGG